MDTLFALLIATVASFIGSLQAGLVNTAVLTATLRHGADSGRRTALGGSLPEFLYAALAFMGAGQVLAFTASKGITPEHVTGVVLVLLGIYIAFLMKPFHIKEGGQARRGGFMRGLLLGLMNPQLLLFWCGIRLGMESIGVHAQGLTDAVAFGIGAFIGALALLLLLVRLGNRLLEAWGAHLLHRVFRVLGLVLIVLGVLAWLPIARKL